MACVRVYSHGRGDRHAAGKACWRVPGLLSEANGSTHQAIEDISLMCGIPGMQVVCPADAEELASVLSAIMNSPRPCYIRHTTLPARVVHTQPFELGRAERLMSLQDVSTCVVKERFGDVANLACFSKSVANGMLLSVLTGRSNVMSLLENEVFFFTTFGGETLSSAAAQATLHVLERDNVALTLKALGSQLRERFAGLCDELQLPFVRCVGFGARTMVTFAKQDLGTNVSPLLQKSLVQQELIRQGILWTGFHNLSAAHTEADIEDLLGSYRHALLTL